MICLAAAVETERSFFGRDRATHRKIGPHGLCRNTKPYMVFVAEAGNVLCAAGPRREESLLPRVVGLENSSA
jgi:hypothetical protein